MVWLDTNTTWYVHGTASRKSVKTHPFYLIQNFKVGKQPDCRLTNSLFCWIVQRNVDTNWSSIFVPISQGDLRLFTVQTKGTSFSYSVLRTVGENIVFVTLRTIGYRRDLQ